MREKEEEDERGKLGENGNEDEEGACERKKRTRLRREREDLSIVLGALSRLEKR